MPTRVDKAVAAIKDAISDEVKGLSKSEYLEVLDTLADDIEVMSEAQEEEMDEEEDADGE